MNIGLRLWRYRLSTARSVQKRPRVNIAQFSSSKLRLVSSLLYDTQAMLVLNLPAFGNKNRQLMTVSTWLSENYCLKAQYFAK